MSFFSVLLDTNIIDFHNVLKATTTLLSYSNHNISCNMGYHWRTPQYIGNSSENLPLKLTIKAFEKTIFTETGIVDININARDFHLENELRNESLNLLSVHDSRSLMKIKTSSSWLGPKRISLKLNVTYNVKLIEETEKIDVDMTLMISKNVNESVLREINGLNNKIEFKSLGKLKFKKVLIYDMEE
ncbi:hypothetical protein H8356DRAFT_1349046 [Neocallimastix lanati (nom. inval.)]|nr:hypothetical protein H8356DRAFT_1349046 [Neocallimastix sp. JGI-2020a]